MTALYYREFKAFVESQPEDRPIDHEGWDNCAIGEFAAHLGVDPETMYPTLPWSEFASDCLPTRDALTQLRDAVKAGRNLPTYGDLLIMLNDEESGSQGS